MAKRKRRKRTTSEKVMIVLGILIALSMVISLFAAGLAGGTGNAPLPPPADSGVPIGQVLPGSAVAEYVSLLANLLPSIA